MDNKPGLKRRGILRFGTLITAVTGASAVSALGSSSAVHAAPGGDKNQPASYVPLAEKGVASGVATLDAASKIPANQIPDLTGAYAAAGGPSSRLFLDTEGGAVSFGSGQAATDVTITRKLDELGNPTLNTASRFTVGSVRFKEDASALNIVEVPGTNGRRLSIEPVHQQESAASAQLQLVPGASVSHAEVTSQILLYHKPGANYERFTISAFNDEYQFHSSKLGTGVARPTFFYVDNQLVTSWLVDTTFCVYSTLRIGTDLSHARLTSPGMGILSTTSSFRVAEGSAHQIRLGNVAGLNRPTISFGDGTVNISRDGAQLSLAGGLAVSGGFGANGATVKGRQPLSAAAGDPAGTQLLVNQIRAALIALGLAQ